MKSRHHFSQITALATVVLTLVACGGNEDELAEESAETSTVVSATMTSQRTSSPAVDSTDRATQSIDREEAPPLTIGTPRDDEPIARDMPSDPPPTQPTTVAAASSFDSDGDGFYTFDELEQAVTALFTSYDWPQNYQVDLDNLKSDLAAMSGPNDQFEAPGEYTIVGLYHVCAWELAWLDAYQEGDARLMEESLDQLRGAALDNPMFVAIQEDLGERFERAELGDPLLIQQDVDNSCTSYEFVTPTSATPRTTINGERQWFAIGSWRQETTAA